MNGEVKVEAAATAAAAAPSQQVVVTITEQMKLAASTGTTSSDRRLLPPRSDSALRYRRSVLSRPKSRNFEGPPQAPAADAGGGGEEEDDEEEEEEVFRREQLSRTAGGKGRGRRWTLRMVVEWPILVLASACLVCSLTVRRLQGLDIWGLEIWKWCVMVVVVFSGRLIAHWVVVLVVFLVEKNFLFKKKVLYFVYGLKNSSQVCIWFGLVLCSWLLLFNRGVRRSEYTTQALNYVSRVLASLWIGSIIWLVKTVLVKLLASSFHVSKYFDRIQESVFHQYILQMLSGPPTVELAEKVGVSQSNGQLNVSNVKKKKGVEGKEKGVIDIAKLYKMKQEKVSAWTMKGLISTIRSSGFLTIASTIDDNIGTEEGGSGLKDEEITSELEAKAVGYRIFKNVAKHGYKYIEEEDLLRFLSKDEVEIMLPMFEGAVDTGKIKKSAMKNWVVKAYLERKFLAHSLTDTKTAVRQLHRLVSVIVIIVIIVVTLLLMGFATKVLVLISSQLLLVAFMFGNTCKTVFEGIIFVFVMHPFDVGDRCVIDGIQMVVEEMNILTTIFLRFDNEKISYPNSVLATKPISNFYRSPDMNDSVDFSIDVFTSAEKIEALRARIKSYLESKPQHWHPKHSVVVKEIVNMNKMNLALYVLHTMNFQNIVEKNSRRTELMLMLKKILEDLNIRYNLLPQEILLSHTPLAAPLVGSQ